MLKSNFVDVKWFGVVDGILRSAASPGRHFKRRSQDLGIESSDIVESVSLSSLRRRHDPGYDVKLCVVLSQ